MIRIGESVQILSVLLLFGNIVKDKFEGFVGCEGLNVQVVGVNTDIRLGCLHLYVTDTGRELVFHSRDAWLGCVPLIDVILVSLCRVDGGVIGDDNLGSTAVFLVDRSRIILDVQ